MWINEGCATSVISSYGVNRKPILNAKRQQMFSVPRPIKEENSLQMKKLPTIAQIGKAALLRVFKPHNTINALEQSSTSVVFPDEQYDLSKPIKSSYSNQHFMGSIQARSGNAFLVWGIQCGLHYLGKIEEEQSAFRAIAKLDCLHTKTSNGGYGIHAAPSHFIVKEWSSDDMSGDHETYTVYRLTPQQERDVRSYVGEFCENECV